MPKNHTRRKTLITDEVVAYAICLEFADHFSNEAQAEQNAYWLEMLGELGARAGIKPELLDNFMNHLRIELAARRLKRMIEAG